MGLINYLNQRMRNLDVFDIKLAQSTAMFFALIVVKLIPEIMNINIWWFVGLGILSAIRPFYSFWLKEY
jgi:hypothetical protein